jgi:homoserine O-acetyltransferase
MTTHNRKQGIEPRSVGIVKPQQVQLFTAPDGLQLECGQSLAPVTVAYETYGQLDDDGRNVILVCHALSGDAHAAGVYAAEDEKPGWWEDMIGPGKAFDTEKYFVVCSNILGGCKGTTGPSSVNPETGKPFGTSFPVVTIHDMVVCQKALLDHLGVTQLLSVTGGSMGGMQALEWAVSHPEFVRSVIPIATTYRLSAQGIAFNEVGRQAIFADPNWKGGDYYGGPLPDVGLALARMIGHITYLSDKSMHEKFGRDLRYRDRYAYNFEQEFQVESYLHHQGNKFTKRFDANSYLYITKAMDYFDLVGEFHSLRDSLARARAKFLMIAFSSDWLFPPYQNREIANALRNNSADVTYVELASDYGHDAFLLEYEAQTTLISAFLKYVYHEVQSGD